MPRTLKWGQTYTVMLDVGAVADAFILDSSTLDGTDTLDGTTDFYDATEYVLDVAIQRGRQNQTTQFSPGTVRLTFDDRASGRLFDPTNSASELYAGDFDLAPGRQVKVLAGTALLFLGKVTDVDISYDLPNLSFCQVVGADALSDLGNLFLTAFTPSSQTTSARVSAILARPEVSYSGSTNITASPTASCGTVAYTDNYNVLQALQGAAYAEDGRFFADRNNTLVFDERIDFSFDSPTAAFAGSGGTAIPFQALSVGYGAETLFNRVSVTVDSVGTAQVASDATSQAKYGIQTLSLTNLPLNTQAAGSALAANLLEKYKDPVVRFDSITTSLNAVGTGLYPTLLTLDVGDIVSVTNTYAVGTPGTVTKNVFIEAVSHAITPTDHRITFSLGQAQLYSKFILNSSTLNSDDRLT
jgi:hypothetical protein